MDPLHVERVGPSDNEQPGRWDEEGWGWGMSYANYCQDQAAACARRARLASSPEIVAYCRTLELRWLKLAEQAQDTGESDPAATLFPLPEKPATYPVEYGKRAGELIARGARSLSPRKRK
jgi:hypothetical protein